MALLPPEEIVKTRQELIERQEKLIADGAHNHVIPSIMLSHQSLASNVYLACGDVPGFRQNMLKATEYCLRSLKLYLEGDKNIDESEIAIFNYGFILCALAGGGFDLAIEFTKNLLRTGEVKSKKGKNDKDYFECGRSHITGIGFSLAGILLQDDAMVSNYIALGHERCAKGRGLNSWKGLPIMLEGIWKKDTQQFNDGLESFTSTYHLYVKSIGGSYQSRLCVYGIGLANLAIHRGMDIILPESKYFPKELVIR